MLAGTAQQEQKLYWCLNWMKWVHSLLLFAVSCLWFMFSVEWTGSRYISCDGLCEYDQPMLGSTIATRSKFLVALPKFQPPAKKMLEALLRILRAATDKISEGFRHSVTISHHLSVCHTLCQSSVYFSQAFAVVIITFFKPAFSVARGTAYYTST